MNTKSIVAETIIAGFFLFMVIVFFVLLQMSNEELLNTFEYFNSISAGASFILVTLVFMFSYTLGSLSHRIGKDLSTLYYKIVRRVPQQTNFPSDPDERQEYFNKWLVKSFYRTLMLSSPFIVVELMMLDNRLSSESHYTTILIVGIILEVIFIISFFTQRNDSLNNN